MPSSREVAVGLFRDPQQAGDAIDALGAGVGYGARVEHIREVSTSVVTGGAD